MIKFLIIKNIRLHLHHNLYLHHNRPLHLHIPLHLPLPLPLPLHLHLHDIVSQLETIVVYYSTPIQVASSPP